MTIPIQRLREWSPLLPLLLLLAATYWLNQQVQPLPPKSDSNKRHDPDFIVSKFVATTLNQQGVKRFIMSAAEMMHYPDDDSTHLREPQLTSFYADRPPVNIFARRGKVSSKGDEVFLHDEVKLVRAPGAAQSRMTLITAYLHVVPDRDWADTDRPITLTDAHNTINAVGMQFDNKARTIKLLAQVRSRYEPAKH